MNKKLITIPSLILLVLPAITLAANYATDVINRLIYMVAWPVVVGLTIIMFIWAGFLYLTAQGEPGKISSANDGTVEFGMEFSASLDKIIYRK